LVAMECGFPTPQWAALPLDEGTRMVIRNAMRILFERGGLLSRAAGG
jgi:hypothetical protein